MQCYLYKNAIRQLEVMNTLLPNPPVHQSNLMGGNKPNEDEITAGQLLCGGLFSNDPLSCWFSAVALAHGMTDQDELKTELLKVQVASAGDTRGPISLLQQVLNILQSTNHVQTRIGLLMMAANWASHSTPAVNQILVCQGVIPFLTGQIGSNEHDEMERLSQGLCAFLLGLLITGNDNSIQNFSGEELMQLVEKRIGVEIFLDKLSEVSKHEAYNRALKHPQIKCGKPGDLVFDHSFCIQFKQQEHLVINHLNQFGKLDSNAEPDPAILMQYKELIRDQDSRISQISQANIYLQQELANARQSLDEMTSAVQTLQDQNSLLKAQTMTKSSTTTNGPMMLVKNSSDIEAKKTIDKLEKELRVRDDIIHELEVRLTLNNHHEVYNHDVNDVEVRNMQAQLDALQAALAVKDTEIEALKSEAEKDKASFDALQAEQEDLLMMLSDQDSKLAEYKRRLKALGQPIEEEEEEEEEELSD